jgi:ABC-type phosphate/phosphonate transport system substrate-binding protein
MSSEAINSQPGPLFVACGMYALTAELRAAWQQLFENFFNLVKPSFELDRSLKFETGQPVLSHPSLWFGQTCGYPLMTGLRDTMTPISVPVFNVDGCNHTSYSSLLIVAEDSEINTLEQCRGLRAAINTIDSNSGMNVLRHAVATFNRQGKFFSEIRISGSHLQSLTEVADQRADIAAIDCVTYRFIEDTWPDLAARVRSIGFSAKTCGLPFVMPKPDERKNSLDGITEYLNRALSLLDNNHKKRLHLNRFEQVNIGEFQGILDLEISAREAGYPVLA